MRNFLGLALGLVLVSLVGLNALLTSILTTILAQ